MIEALKSEELIEKVGGRFKLCVLIQRRLNELLDGSRPLVERDGRSDLEVAIEEIVRDKITLRYLEEGEEPFAELAPAGSPRSLPGAGQPLL